MARLREVSWVYDWGFLDEPIFVSGPVTFTWRRFLGLFMLVLLALVFRAGSKMPVPRSPLGLDQIILSGVTAGLSLLLLAPRGVVPIEQQLVSLLFPIKGKEKQNRRKKGSEEIVVRTDIIPYSLEISGYALDLRTGKSLKTGVLIKVDDKVIETTPDTKGYYRTVVELGPGIHTVVVELKEPRVRLKTLRIKVVER